MTARVLGHRCHRPRRRVPALLLGDSVSSGDHPPRPSRAPATWCPIVAAARPRCRGVRIGHDLQGDRLRDRPRLLHRHPHRHRDRGHAGVRRSGKPVDRESDPSTASRPPLPQTRSSTSRSLLNARREHVFVVRFDRRDGRLAVTGRSTATVPAAAFAASNSTESTYRAGRRARNVVPEAVRALPRATRDADRASRSRSRNVWAPNAFTAR